MMRKSTTTLLTCAALACIFTVKATVTKPSSCFLDQVRNENIDLVCFESNGEPKDVRSEGEHGLAYEGARCVQMCSTGSRTAYCSSDGHWEYHPDIVMPCFESIAVGAYLYSNTNGTNGIHQRSKRDASAPAAAAKSTFGTFLDDLKSGVSIISSLADIYCKVFGCGATAAAKRDTTPPTITCQPTTQTSPIVALPGERDAVVSWPAPTASDDSGTPTVEKWMPISKNSGDRFPSGSYAIVYVAKDSSGNMASCSPIAFDVKVYTCSVPRNPVNGQHDYNAPDPPTLGDHIHFSCQEGYNLTTGSSDQVCQLTSDKAVWSGGGTVTCSKVQCSARVAPTNTELTCTSSADEFGTACILLCINSSYAYAGTPGMKRYASCMATGQWSDPLDSCVDARPPVFKSCPSSKIVYADKALTTATVSWDAVVAVDNAGNNVTPKAVRAPPFSSGSSGVATGIYDFEYTAIDSRGREATSHCYFSIRVDLIPCPPLTSQPYLTMTPPANLVYGSCYNFVCQFSFKMQGPTSVCCETSSTSPGIGYWDWSANGGNVTMCKVINCTKLHVPNNGAMACDANWVLGGMCSMFCNDQFDIPPTAGTLGVYTCDRSVGTWNPGEYVPDCSEARQAGVSYLRSLLNYYSGDCSDPNVQQNIKDNFISILKDPVAGPIFGNICATPNACIADNIAVECGAYVAPATGRRRRTTPAYTLTVRFRLNTKLVYPSGKVNATIAYKVYTQARATLNNMAAIFRQSLQKGAFDNLKVPALNLQIDRNSFAVNDIEFECADGSSIRLSTMNCVVCSVGTYAPSGAQQCLECPVGTFQDKRNQPSCISCPTGKSTAFTMAISSANCTDMCPSGAFSLTGVVPCSLCPEGTYQPSTGQKTCLNCPPSTRSPAGSKAQTNCQGFELSLTGKAVIQKAKIVAVYSSIKPFSLSVWLRVSLAALSDSIVTMGTVAQPTSILTLDTPQQISASMLRLHRVTSSVNIADDRWHHVVLTLNPATCLMTLYVDSSNVNQYTIPSGICVITMSNSTYLFIGSSANAGSSRLYVNSLTLWNRTLTTVEVTQLSTSCTTAMDDSAALFRWAQVLTATRPSGVNIYSPSTCGDGNDCVPNPCNGSPCVDKIYTYECQCVNGASGRRCEVGPDYCKGVSCKNGGNCSVVGGAFKCNCPAAYTGTLCENAIVNGGWSDWTLWTSCSQTCGDGVQGRLRLCNNPKPNTFGADCGTASSETKACNGGSCAQCPDIANMTSDGMTVTCQAGAAVQRCNISCDKPGREFDADAYTSYVCGSVTSYKWHPDQLPHCTKNTVPDTVTYNVTVDYPVCPVNMAVAMADINNKVKQVTIASDCVKKTDCEAKITTSCRSTSRKRAVSKFTVTISINGRPQASTYFNGDTYNATAANLARSKYATIGNDIVTQANGMKTAFGSDKTAAITTSSDVKCGAGYRRFYDMCVTCRPGQYESGRQCIACATGTYQDLEGQTSCKSCYSGTTTKLTGATKAMQCVKA